jgi:hypothetical protein
MKVVFILTVIDLELLWGLLSFRCSRQSLRRGRGDERVGNGACRPGSEVLFILQDANV